MLLKQQTRELPPVTLRHQELSPLSKRTGKGKNGGGAVGGGHNTIESGTADTHKIYRTSKTKPT